MNFKNIFFSKKSFFTVAIFSIAFLSAFAYNQLNLHYLKKSDNNYLRSGETIKTSDDVSYLFPPLNFLENKTWKDNSIKTDIRSYFIRPPGYGIFYLIHVILFGEREALMFLKISQLLLFALSVLLLYKICRRHLINQTISITCTAIYGFTPFAIGFLYYTLTEGITPALVIIYLYFLTEASFQQINQKKIMFYLCSALTISIIIIIRPVLAILGIFFLFYILYDHKIKANVMSTLKNSLIYGMISFSLFTIWSIRNYEKTNEFVGFHPIYYNESNSIYRKTHQSIWEFYKCWGIKNEDYHTLINSIWNPGIKGDTSKIHLHLAMKAIPEDVKKIISQTEIINAFKLYQASILLQKLYFEQDKAMPKSLSVIEFNTIKEFQNFKEKYEKQYFFKYHVLTPVKNFWRLSAHSNLSLWIFQEKFRGNLIMEFFRILFYIIHVGILIVLFFSVFVFRKDLVKLTYPVSALVYLFFLCYILKEWEERYTLPLLPICFINLALLVEALKKKIIYL